MTNQIFQRIAQQGINTRMEGVRLQAVEGGPEVAALGRDYPPAPQPGDVVAQRLLAQGRLRHQLRKGVPAVLLVKASENPEHVLGSLRGDDASQILKGHFHFTLIYGGGKGRPSPALYFLNRGYAVSR